MPLPFEEALPAQFVAFHHPESPEWDCPYFVLLWPKMDNPSQRLTPITFAPPHTPLHTNVHLHQYYCVLFQSSFLDSADIIANGKEPVIIPATLYTRHLQELISYLYLNPDQNQARLSCLISALINEMIGNVTAVRKPLPPMANDRKADALKEGKAIIYATRYMRKNMSNPHLSLNHIANAIGYHPNYFCYEFSKVFSVSPIRFLNNLRLKRTLQLLENSDLNVKTICEIVGFPNAGRLISMVRATSGMSPVLFRRSKRLQHIK
ncbi:helix-turn-helix domain-containing protein [Cohnella cholangitidis]|uniref:Helix-turn-helix transcriptional regulator n=1 Tax=Cohnella cholangitidis TaxID=2598458 RepID=A0A7G5BUI0_9BACL|nr:AraC family transcriptional regulator [Cohnella cholangitidis]QMV40614.1 helix-turn-helix transcriptional regulator [Cohnella cholangitidis]